MIKALKVFLVFHTLFFLFIFHSTVYASLENSVPFKTWVDAKTIANIEFVVPDGTTKLSVVISDGSGDLDLYLKYGSPVSGGTISDIDADADIVSDGPTADETIVISPYTTPALIPGTWHIATLNLNNETTTFTLTATIETEKKLPLPDSMTSYPTYAPIAKAVTGTNVKTIKPIGVGNIADSGDTVAIEVELVSPDGPYDAYFALHAPVIAPNELFMLSQDGNLYPASKKGLVKWKQSATGPIDEKPFGEFPISALPGGTYNLHFLLTEVNSLDSYYLWSTHFDAPENVPDGSAGYFNGNLMVPNATIIYQGTEYQESASIPSDALVGIIRDGKTYLYHSSMGKVVVSDEMTRRAVGRFVMGTTTGDVQQKSNRSGLAPNSNNLLNVSSTVKLKTGIELQRQAPKLIKVINNQFRWVAVKGTDGSGPYFIPPAGRTIDNNELRMLGTYLKWDSTWFNDSKSHEFIYKPSSDSLVIETYAAAWRPIAYYFDYAPYYSDKLYYYFTGKSAPPISDPIPVDGIDLRNQKDAELGLALDRIDMWFMITEGIKSFAATKDITEVEEVPVTAAMNLAMAFVHRFYSGEAGHRNVWSTLQTMAEDLSIDGVHVLAQLFTEGGASAFLTLVDAIASLDYLVEGVAIHEVNVLGSYSYDEIRMEPPNDSDSCVIGAWRSYIGENCSNIDTGSRNDHLITLGFNPETNTNTATVSAAIGDWKLEGSGIDIEAKSSSNLTIKFSGDIRNQCNDIQGYMVDFYGQRSCWFATRIRPY